MRTSGSPKLATSRKAENQEEKEAELPDQLFHVPLNYVQTRPFQWRKKRISVRSQPARSKFTAEGLSACT